MRIDLKKKLKWRPWFAWHPVITDTKVWVWLRVVERRWSNDARFSIVHPDDPGMYESGWVYRERNHA